VYPEPQSSSKSNRSGGKSTSKSGTDGSSPEDQDDEDEDESKERLPAILDDDEEEEDGEADSESKLTIKQDTMREASDTPSLTIDRSPSPATEVSSHPPPRPPLARKISNQTAKQSGKSSSNIPQDVKFYLNYFRNHMSHHHYSLKRDSGNFLKTEFLEMALKHEPLRYAVVGYAAYFHTLSKPEGRMSNFLQYYNESVSRLRASITKSRKQTLSTFCTILQLASIEVRMSIPLSRSNC
jgi:hypothetical protein